ncbi:MAG: S8 family peptidase, partial [Planctomycetes bacterium]|nr:S8 family peptidase [Planctomycetota bacterium]
MRLYRSLCLFLFVLVLVPVCQTGAVAAPQDNTFEFRKLDGALKAAVAVGAGPQRVIVRARPGFRAALEQVLQAHGSSIRADHPSINGISAVVETSELTSLAAEAVVASVSQDVPVTAGSAGAGQGWRSMPGPGLLRATLGLEAGQNSGSGVGVAIVDSGIAPSTDFAGRLAAFFDFTNGGARNVYPFDDYGHGTHVAGLIGGTGLASGFQYQGVAPSVRFVGVKVLDKTGCGFTSDVVRALEFLTANRERLGVQVVNLSLGHPVFEPAATDPLVQAVEEAVRAGLVVVTSAGNFGKNPVTGEIGYTGITSPGNAPSAITVGSAVTFGTVPRGDDRVATYSSRGPTWYDAFAKPDIVAPGDSLVSVAAPGSTLYLENPSLRVGRRYMKLSGTSMSTAVVSGVVALMLDASARTGPGPHMTVTTAVRRDRPMLTANAVKAILQYTAIRVLDDAGAEYDYLTQGGGEVNAAGAIEMASAINETAPVGTVWVSFAPRPVTTIGGEELVWARNIVWGSWVLTNTTGIFVNQPLWSNNIVWGNLDADNIVWGNLDADNIVWGNFDADNIVWGNVEADNIVWGNLRADNIVWGNLRADNIV